MVEKVKSWPWLPILTPVVAVFWFGLRPFDWPPDWLEVSLAAVHVAGMLVGYFFIRRLDDFVMQVGWTLLGLQFVIDLCGEFTRNQDGDTAFRTVLAVFGSVLLAVGIARSQAIMQSEAERTKRREEQLRHDANHDRLTGLANRSHFLDELTILWHQTAPDDRSAIAVLFIDLDAFKAVNDRYGHLVGDELLQVVGRRLRAAVRGADIVARVGGDEFAALVSGLGGDEALDALLERVHDRLTKAIVINGSTITPEASIGVVRGGDEYTRAKELLRAADAAMYAAKRSKHGGGSIEADG